VRGGFKLAGFGVGIGIVAALVSTRYLASLLYGVKPTDPPTFATVALLLIGSGPARQLHSGPSSNKSGSDGGDTLRVTAYAISTKHCDWASITVPKGTRRTGVG